MSDESPVNIPEPQPLPYWHFAFEELHKWSNWMVHDENLVPHNPRTLLPADPNDPANRSDYETAIAALRDNNKPLQWNPLVQPSPFPRDFYWYPQNGWGIGFVLKDTPFVVVANTLDQYETDNPIERNGGLRSILNTYTEFHLGTNRDFRRGCPLGTLMWCKAADIQLEQKWPALGLTLLCVAYVPFIFELASVSPEPIEERTTELKQLLEILKDEPSTLTDNFLHCVPHVLDIHDSEVDNPVVENLISDLLT